MSDKQVIDLSNVVSVTVQSAVAGLALENINTAALFSTEESDPDIGAFKIYTNPSDVEADWGSDSKAFAIASNFFAQQPNPLSTGGYLVIIPLLSSGTEKIQTAIARTINSVYYFGILADQVLDGTDLHNLAVAVQALDKIAFYASATAADYAPGGMLDLLRTNGETHTRGLFYSNDSKPWLFAAAYAGRALSTDFAGVNTTQTMNLQTLANITPDEAVDETAVVATDTAGVDVYVSLGGAPSLLTSGGNQFFDEVYNEFWLKFQLQTDIFNFLRSSGTKVPQTEVGMNALKNVCRRVCAQGVLNGFIGPGAWNSPTVFGNPADLIRNIKDVGYYVFSGAVDAQSQTDREARIAPRIQIAVKTQGAIQKVNITVNINI